VNQREGFVWDFLARLFPQGEETEKDDEDRGKEKKRREGNPKNGGWD